MGWNYFFAASGAACAAIVFLALCRKMKEGSGSGLQVEVYETKILETEDLRTWVWQNRSDRPLEVYLLYGNKGRLAGNADQRSAEILKYMEQKTKVFSRFDDFIVQLLFDEKNHNVEKYRIITFKDVAKDLNDIFEKNRFYREGIIHLV